LSRRKEDPGDSPISDIVFHPTEPVVAVTGGDGLISLWNTETDTFTPLESFSPDDVVAIWFDSSGRLKAINDSAHVITWDVRKPAARPLGELIKGIDAPVRAAVVNPLNENLMAIATGDRDIISIVQGLRAETLPGRTMILPFVDGKPPAPPFRELTGGNAASVQSLAFDHTGTFLWTGGAGGDICVWTTGQRELTRTLRAHRGSVNALRASRDGRSMLSAGADGTARVWAASPLPATLLEGLKGQVGALAVGPRGEWVVGGDQNGTIRAWDASGKERWTAKHKDALSALAVSRDGSLIASAGGQALGSGRNPGGDTAIRLWNARDGQLIREIANREDVLGAAFSADSKFLLTAGIAPGVQVWDVASGKVVRQMTTADAQPSMQLGLSGNGRIVAVGDGRNTILIWQYETAARLKDIKLPKNQMTSGSALDETGRLLLVTSFSSTDAELFDTADGRRIRRFALGGSGANGTDLSHNGVLAVTANISGPPALWDLASGRVLASLAPAFGAWHVLFSSDARRIAVSSSDGSIFLLECTFCVASGDLLKLAAARATRTFTDEERRTFLSDESPLPGSTRVP
jgi:WD40 repeat protein